MKLSTKSLDHLGLVAGVFDELRISDVIDEAIPKLGITNFRILQQ